MRMGAVAKLQGVRICGLRWRQVEHDVDRRDSEWTLGARPAAVVGSAAEGGIVGPETNIRRCRGVHGVALAVPGTADDDAGQCLGASANGAASYPLGERARL